MHNSVHGNAVKPLGRFWLFTSLICNLGKRDLMSQYHNIIKNISYVNSIFFFLRSSGIWADATFLTNNV